MFSPLEIINSKKIIIGEGANSVVYKINLKGNNYALKKYKNNSLEVKHKITREYSFLNETNFIGINCVPKYIQHSFKENYLLITFLEGKKPYELSENYINKFCDFLGEIQQIKKKHKDKLLSASDKLEKGQKVLFKISRKQCEIEKKISSYSNNDNYKKFFYKKIKIEFSFLKEKFERHLFFLKSLDLTRDNTIYSPSDVGIHNSLVIEDKVYFIDFEHSGLDSIYKLVADSILNPNQNNSIKLIEYFLKNIKNKLLITIDEEVLIASLLIYRIKWLHIMSKQFIYNDYFNPKEKSIERLKEYSISTINLIRHIYKLLNIDDSQKLLSDCISFMCTNI